MLRIKEILKEQGITQIELAERLVVSPVGLNKIINGNPTLETLEKIAEALGVHIQDLFEDKPTDGTPLYIKHGDKLVEVGQLDMGKVKGII